MHFSRIVFSSALLSALAMAAPVAVPTEKDVVTKSPEAQINEYRGYEHLYKKEAASEAGTPQEEYRGYEHLYKKEAASKAGTPQEEYRGYEHLYKKEAASEAGTPQEEYRGYEHLYKKGESA